MNSILKKTATVAVAFLVLVLHAAPIIQDGDRVVFLGDSITHAGSYICWAQAFYELRTPMNVRFYNAGISGDSATGGLNRLKKDVLARNPNKVVIMFGMNDVGRHLYSKGGTQIDEKRDAALKRYEKNLNKICEELQNAKIEVVLCTPTPFDQYSKNSKSTCNEPGLASIAQIVRDTAKKRGLKLIDYHSPMTEILKNQPKCNPISGDRVHPNYMGHLMMTYFFCKQSGLDGKISTVKLDFKTGKLVLAENAEVTDLRRTSNGFTFQYQPSKLPFKTVAKWEKDLNTLVPFTQEFNTELLQIEGLEEGTYSVSGEGFYSKFSSEDLAKGVNLAQLNTPARKQSAKASKQIAVIAKCHQALRNVALADRYAKQMKADPNDPDACLKAVDEWFAREFPDQTKTSGRKKYYESIIRSYKKNKKNVDEIEKRLEEAFVNLRKECHPVSYQLVIRKEK